jgi:hypothetical protein
VNNLNVEKAEKSVQYYAQYWKENNYDNLDLEKFPQDFSEQFYAYVGGADKEGRPST